jgi:hypothetical protein
MNRSMRHQINAAVCALVLGHAVYWFISGEAYTATALRTGLAVGQATLALIGFVWFLRRARQTAG